jgi:hypothetical protein
MIIVLVASYFLGNRPLGHHRHAGRGEPAPVPAQVSRSPGQSGPSDPQKKQSRKCCR